MAPTLTTLTIHSEYVGQESTCRDVKMYGVMCVEIVEAQTDNVPMPLWRKSAFDLLFIIQ